MHRVATYFVLESVTRRRIVVGVFSIALPRLVAGASCSLRSYGSAKFVCVCNATFCDQVPQPANEDLASGAAWVVTSARDGSRLQAENVTFKRGVSNCKRKNTVCVKVNPHRSYQTLMGFGGAFTDAAGMNIAALPTTAQQHLLESYFGKDGARYSIGRVPIASCDFSTSNYSYDDVVDDFKLVNFKLANEDLNFKIPFIRQAMSMVQRVRAGGTLRLFGSPWSGPGWMKSSGQMTGAGWLKGDAGGSYYRAWANYFVRFLDAYAEHNVTFWGLTVQNEPTTGFIPNYQWQTMGFTPHMMRDFVKTDLGPALNASGYGKMKLMIHDDQRFGVNIYADRILNDQTANVFVSGVAVHFYADTYTPVTLLDMLHTRHPDKFILATEACTGSFGWQRGPSLGDWDRAEHYAQDIIQDLNHWMVGWTDWNLALDETGGPNWVGNFVDSPIIVNATAGEFYKQPMFYALAHFSAYLPPNSVRVYSSSSDRLVHVLAASLPTDKRVTVVLLNKSIEAKNIRISLPHLGKDQIDVNMKPKSLATVIVQQ